MHIPDGYLSPQTCAAMGVAMLPIWTIAAKKVNKSVRTRYVPLMAIGAAFSFTIMMYNIPIPDGTTAHAVGGGILSIILGPWAAAISISVALAIQALLFGDGSILAFGANCFNMAFVFPFTSYYIYRLIAGRSEITAARRWVGGLIAGYVGINLAALCAAVEFGLQPTLFHAANGAPLYCPYPLNIAVPAMAFGHLLIAGPVEAVATALVIRYIQAANPDLLTVGNTLTRVEARGYSKLWWGVGAMILLSPLGLLAQGTAWGEWGADEIKDMLGFIPAGLEHFSDSWHVLMPDYSIPGLDGALWQSAIGYILTAIAGVAIIGGITYLFGKYQGRADQGKEMSN